eukprot:6198886-Pleurochrysis_carterae.AAC.3
MRPFADAMDEIGPVVKMLTMEVHAASTASVPPARLEDHTSTTSEADDAGTTAKRVPSAYRRSSDDVLAISVTALCDMMSVSRVPTLTLEMRLQFVTSRNVSEDISTGMEAIFVDDALRVVSVLYDVGTLDMLTHELMSSVVRLANPSPGGNVESVKTLLTSVVTLESVAAQATSCALS